MFNKLLRAVEELIYKLKTYSIEKEIKKSKKKPSALIDFEKDLLALLKKWEITKNPKGLQEIEIKCSVHEVPQIRLTISKYWKDK